MNIRQKYEMKMLSIDGRVSMEKIAEIFSINLRTVRYDIQILNDYLLQELGQEYIQVIRKNFQVEEEVKGRLAGLSGLGVRDFYADRISGEERLLMIVFDLCWSSQPSTIKDIADKYFVSRTTVNADMVAVKDYCKKNDISLISQRGKGIYIDADEIGRRRYLSKVIRDFTAATASRSRDEIPVYSQWFDEKGLERIKAIIADAEEEFSAYLDDIAYEALVVHIALSIERFKTNEEYGEIVGVAQIRQDSLQYQMALNIVGRVNQVFDIQLPDTEIYYVAVHMGAKSSAIISQEKYEDIFLEYYCIKTISSVSKLIDCDLTNDERLYDSLFQHLNACAYRKKNGMLLENPLKEELIRNYQALFEAVRAVLLDADEPDVIVPTDDEVTYILLHFAAAINRKRQNARRTVNVVVVCATGIGTAELVITGLNRNFSLDIKGTVARHQLDKFLQKEDVDLIITTVPVRTRKPFVKVSPLLKRDDIVRISKQLLDMGFHIDQSMEVRDGDSMTAMRLKALLKQYSSREDEAVLLREVRRLARCGNKTKIEGKFMLSELVNERSLRLNTVCCSWEEAVRESGQILIANGDSTDEYVQTVIEWVRTLLLQKAPPLPIPPTRSG